MKIELREDLIISDILKNKTIDENANNTIRLLIKHYKNQGMDKEQIYNSVDDFMKTNCVFYNSVTWFDNVNNTIKNIIKYDTPIVSVKEVYITKSELECINNLKIDKHKKLAFTFLVYAKILNQINPNNKNWVNGKHRPEIFKDANVTETGKEQLITIHRMIKADVLVMAKSIINNSLNVGNYINEEDEIVWIIDDFRELGLQYLVYTGDIKGTVECTECGKYIKYKSKKKPKYCKECAKKIDNKNRKNRGKKQ